MKFLNVTILCALVVLFSAQAFAQKSTFYFDKIYDYPQSELQKIIKNYDRGGFCAPAGASNILKTFHANRVDQGQMIKLLASPEYMNTDPNKGTTIQNFMLGLEKYMNTHLRGYKSIEYAGIGSYGKFSAGIQVPTLEWIADGLGLKRGVWLTLHMLQYDEKNDRYRVVGGHMVTLVGYTLSARNNILVVHDSASPPKEGRDKEFLHFEPIESGSIILGEHSIPAKGFLKIAKGQKIQYATSAPYDTIIISGAVRIDGNVL